MRRLLTVVLATGLLAGCSGEADDPAEVADDAAATASEATVDDAVATDPPEPEGPPPAPASQESCNAPATTIGLDETTAGEVGDDSLYYCVEVPPGLVEVRFELSELDADVDLYVAHDTIDEVIDGGLNLRIADGGDASDRVITVTPSLYRGELLGFDTYADVTPAPYYVEVTGRPSTFSLTVTGTPG